MAVSAFYDKLKHQLSQCQSYRKPHTLHPLSGGVANRLPLCSAPGASAPWIQYHSIRRKATESAAVYRAKRNLRIYIICSCNCPAVLLLYKSCLFSETQARRCFKLWQSANFVIRALPLVSRSVHSHRRSNRAWKPNVKRVKAIVDGSPKHVYVCTRCLRSGKVTRAV